MIQDDDNIVMQSTAEDAQFEADLNQELEKAVQYNRGRELSWTFPITLVTYSGQKSIHTLSYPIPRGITYESIPQHFKQFIYEQVYAFKALTIKYRGIIESNSYSKINEVYKKILYTDMFIGAHK